MAFTPYSIYTTRLPTLKVGHFVEAAGKMYQVAWVRRLRILIPLTAATDEEALNESTTNPEYVTLHGNLEVKRITHLQYIACTGASPNDVELYWMKEPLGSRWHKVVANSALFPVNAPWEVDRWSHNREQRIAYTLAAALTQSLYFENIEYEVIEYKKALTKGQMYLKIFANGQARMVEVA